MNRGVTVAVFLLLASAALAAAETPGSPLIAGAIPDSRACTAEGLKGEIAANQRDLSALETQIRAHQSQQATAETQMNALNPSDPVGSAQRDEIKHQYDSGLQHIAQLEGNAKLMRNHIAELEAELPTCGLRSESANNTRTK